MIQCNQRCLGMCTVESRQVGLGWLTWLIMNCRLPFLTYLWQNAILEAAHVELSIGEIRDAMGGIASNLI